MKHVIITRWLANPNWRRSHFPHDFRSLDEYFNWLDTKAKSLMLLKWSRRAPSIILVVQSRMLLIFWAWFSNFPELVYVFMTILISTPTHIPLKYMCPNKKSNQIRVVYLTVGRTYVLVIAFIVTGVEFWFLLIFRNDLRKCKFTSFL